MSSANACTASRRTLTRRQLDLMVDDYVNYPQGIICRECRCSCQACNSIHAITVVIAVNKPTAISDASCCSCEQQSEQTDTISRLHVRCSVVIMSKSCCFAVVLAVICLSVILLSLEADAQPTIDETNPITVDSSKEALVKALVCEYLIGF